MTDIQEAIERLQKKLAPENMDDGFRTVRTDDLRVLLDAYDARAPREVKLYNCGEDGHWCSERCAAYRKHMRKYERYNG